MSSAGSGLRWVRSSWVAPTLAMFLLYAYMGYRSGLPDGFRYLSHIQVGTRFVKPSRLLPGQRPTSVYGYDGQFYFVIAQDPFLTNRDTAASLDNTLRYRRILYPLLAWVLGFGQRQLVPYSLVAVNLLSVVGLVGMGAGQAARRGRTPWSAVSLGLFGGVWISFVLNLTEPTQLLLLGAGAMTGSAGLTLLSALSKETSAVAMVTSGARAVKDRDWRAAVRWGMALLVVITWSLLVAGLLRGPGESTLGGHFLDPVGAPFLQLQVQWGPREALIGPAVLICLATVARVIWVRDLSSWSAAAYALIGLGAGNDTWVDPTAYYRVIAGAVVLVFVSWTAVNDRLGRYLLLAAAVTGAINLVVVLTAASG